jgi:flagellar protein FlaG
LKEVVDIVKRVIFLIDKEFAMDGLQNVANHQNTQLSQSSAQGRVATEQVKQTTTVQEMQKGDTNPSKQINSQNDVNELVKKMNSALSPFNTSIKFGVDTHDTFYVSVIDSQTDKMIRRFPAEQASSILPKMQELTGIVFDTKG